MSFMPVILWSDALVFLLLAAGIACAWYVRQREHLLLPWRRVAQSATAMVSLLVLSLFLLIGLLDTLHYRVALPENNNGKTVYSPEVLSAFDKLVTPLRTHTEKTYSSPLAATLYAKESIEMPDGKVLRKYPPFALRWHASDRGAATGRRCTVARTDRCHGGIGGGVIDGAGC